MKTFARLFAAALLAVGLSISAAEAQQTGVLIGGGGLTIFKTLQMGAGALLVGQGQAADPVIQALSGDCTLTGGGVIICLKSSGSAFGTAAFANTGTSGTAVPLLNVANTFSADQTFSAHVRVGSSAPTLSSCGTGPAIVGDDTMGEVTMGTGSPTGCVITFAAAYAAAPLCAVIWEATPLVSQSYAVSASAITTTQTATSSNKLVYSCRSRNAG